MSHNSLALQHRVRFTLFARARWLARLLVHICGIPRSWPNYEQDGVALKRLHAAGTYSTDRSFVHLVLESEIHKVRSLATLPRDSVLDSRPGASLRARRTRVSPPRSPGLAARCSTAAVSSTEVRAGGVGPNSGSRGRGCPEEWRSETTNGSSSPLPPTPPFPTPPHNTPSLLPTV